MKLSLKNLTSGKMPKVMCFFGLFCFTVHENALVIPLKNILSHIPLKNILSHLKHYCHNFVHIICIDQIMFGFKAKKLVKIFFLPKVTKTVQLKCHQSGKV